MAKRELPIYLFTGFLEAGKTSFIQETLSDPNFNDGSSTLVILCEEGEEELDSSKYPSKNVFVESVENEKSLSAEGFEALENKYRPDRVIIEYNGMWLIDNLYKALPENWLVYQEMMVIDGSTFIDYNTNIRQLMVDKLTSADPVIFNRVAPDFDKMLFHKTVRGVSRSCAIIYEYTNKQIELDDIEDPLPYDINADIIEISDDDYAYFYRDLSEEFMKYDGKTVSFKGLVVKDEKFPPNTLAVGRQMMICCQEDIAYRAFATLTKEAKKYKTGDWIKLTAKVKIEANKLYTAKGPVMYFISAEPATLPEKIVATF